MSAGTWHLPNILPMHMRNRPAWHLDLRLSATMASMTACVMDAIYRIVHVYRTYSCYSHSMASVLPSRHSSYTQFSASTRNACRRMTRCRVSSASGTKVGTTSKTFFKLRALSFCFCPKGASGRDSDARLCGIARFWNSTALLPASRQLQSQVN